MEIKYCLNQQCVKAKPVYQFCYKIVMTSNVVMSVSACKYILCKCRNVHFSQYRLIGLMYNSKHILHVYVMKHVSSFRGTLLELPVTTICVVHTTSRLRGCLTCPHVRPAEEGRFSTYLSWPKPCTRPVGSPGIKRNANKAGVKFYKWKELSLKRRLKLSL